MRLQNFVSFLQRIIFSNALLLRVLLIVLGAGTLVATVVQVATHQKADTSPVDDFIVYIKKIKQDLRNGLCLDYAADDRLNCLCKSIQSLKTAIIKNPSHKDIFSQGNASWQVDIFQPAAALFNHSVDLVSLKDNHVLIARILRQVDGLCDELTDQGCEFYNTDVSDCAEKWSIEMHRFVEACKILPLLPEKVLAPRIKETVVSPQHSTAQPVQAQKSSSGKNNPKCEKKESAQVANSDHAYPVRNYPIYDYPSSGTHNHQDGQMVQQTSSEKGRDAQELNVPAWTQPARQPRVHNAATNSVQDDLDGLSAELGKNKQVHKATAEPIAPLADRKKEEVAQKIKEKEEDFKAEAKRQDEKIQKVMDRENEDTLRLWLELMNK